MRIEGEHRFDVAPEQVWEGLHDRASLAVALPGVRRLDVTGDDEYVLTVDVGVGSVKGTYEGTFALSDQQPPEACTVTARASGRPGTVATVARMRLTAEGNDGALLAYEADATVTGPLAGVGQRLVAGAARRTTEQFLGRLEERLVNPPEAEEVPVGEGPLAEPELGLIVRHDARVIAVSALAGAAAALLGVAVGRWTARR
jgi:carbon monoxide dehydrogenase subunit G